MTEANDRADHQQRGSILITGCSSGIGLNAATTLGARGWRVIASCRKEEDCERIRQTGLESIRLDYRDEDSITEALEWTLERTGGRLDALYNNGALCNTRARSRIYPGRRCGRSSSAISLAITT